MMKNNVRFFIYLLILGCIGAFLFLYLFFRKRDGYITINGNKIAVEIADNALSHYQGLSNRDYLCENCGMLFIFKNKDKRDFVMRNMKFNLDIIWINGDKIIGISKNLEKEGGNPKVIYGSKMPVDLVLEVNAGFCDRYGIKEGDKINF